MPSESPAGSFPFSRGIHTEMYRERLWTIRQYAGFGTAAQSNQRMRYLLAQGQDGLSIAFDLPTQMGLDSDASPAEGEVGRVGVAIDTVEDMHVLLHDIPLADVSVSMTINATAPILMAMYAVCAEEQALDLRELRGTVQNDMLKEFVARGTYIYPVEPSLKLSTDLVAWCVSAMPLWNPLSVSGYHIREAGCTAAQEVAFTLAHAVEYLTRAKDAGVDLELLGKRTSFFFCSHSNLLEEVAKFRAARELWAHVTRNTLKIASPEAQKLRFHVQTAGSTLQAQEPLNNLVRTTLQALSAVWGGCQSLHVNAYDEALALPTEESARVAIQTQQILACEAGMRQFVDPLHGSEGVESLVTELSEQTKRLLAEVTRMGGAAKAVCDGHPQRLIEQAAYRTQQQVERGAQRVVGLNAFVGPASEVPRLHQHSTDSEVDQVARLRAARSARDREKVDSTLRHVEHTAQAGDNVLPGIVQAVRARATVGEISSSLRRVYGSHDYGSHDVSDASHVKSS